MHKSVLPTILLALAALSGRAHVALDARVCVSSADVQEFLSTTNAEIVYAIDLRDSTYVKLVETTNRDSASETNMRWSHLWVEVPDGFEEEPTWLDPDAAVPPSTRHRGARSRTVTLVDNLLRTSRPISSVAVHDAAGRRVWAKDGLGGRVVRIPHARLCRCVQLVRVRLVDGTRTVIRRVAFRS